MNNAMPSVSRLDDHLGYLLRAVSNQVSHSFALQVEGQGVTVAEWVVLRQLHGQPPLPPSQLAGAMGMTRGAISKLETRLLAKGLITARADKSDGRAHFLALTAKGRALVPVLAGLADANDTAFFDCLTGAERVALKTLLNKITTSHAITAVPVE